MLKRTPDIFEFISKINTQNLIRVSPPFIKNPHLFVYTFFGLLNESKSIYISLYYTYKLTRNNCYYIKSASRFLMSRLFISNFRNKNTYFRHLSSVLCMADTTKCGQEISIVFTEAKEAAQSEGHFSFLINFNGEKIIELSFIIIDRCKFSDKKTILITRIQGCTHKYDNIKLLNKHYKDLRLGDLLLSAVEGFARYLHIEKILAVPALLQPSYRHQSNFISVYDGLLTKFFTTKRKDGLFETSMPFSINSIESISGRHRSRHRHHTSVRKAVSENTLNALLSTF